MKIQVVSFDPALSNFGMAHMMLNLETLEFEVIDIKLIKTERRVNKQVRQNSDDLRRSQELFREFNSFSKKGIIGFAEIPTGAQSARAAYAFGVAVGLMASCPIPIIQVQAYEAKLAAVGTKTASKEEMIEAMVEKYPDAPWLKRKSKGVMVLLNDNEHLADAIAIAHAGVRTQQFEQLRAVWRSGLEPINLSASL